MTTRFSKSSFLSTGYSLYLFGMVYLIGSMSGRADLLVYEGFDIPSENSSARAGKRME